MEQTTRRAHKPWKLFLVLSVKLVLGIGLAILILKYSIGGYLARHDPAIALRLDAENPTALLSMAHDLVERALAHDREAAWSETRVLDFAAPRALLPGRNGTALPPSKRSQPLHSEQVRLLETGRVLTQRALVGDPLNYRSATLLARLTELLDSDDASAAARPFYEYAARLTPRAGEAIFWLLRDDLKKMDYDQVIARADTLLRTNSHAPSAVHPLLARLLESESATEAVTRLLLGDPPWRDRFVSELPRYATQARTPLRLLLALKERSRPPTIDNLRAFLDVLLARKLYELAYGTWLQFLPARQLANLGFLFNGSFESSPSGLPFDWVFNPGAGVAIDIMPLATNLQERGLLLKFSGGRAQSTDVTQILVLAPGRYLLTGKYTGHLQGRRGLRWRVGCLGETSAALAQTPMHVGPSPTWRAFELVFTVPAHGCAAQRLRLMLDARTSSEHLVGGAMWYDDLRLERDGYGSMPLQQ